MDAGPKGRFKVAWRVGLAVGVARDLGGVRAFACRVDAGDDVGPGLAVGEILIGERRRVPPRLADEQLLSLLPRVVCLARSFGASSFRHGRSTQIRDDPSQEF